MLRTFEKPEENHRFVPIGTGTLDGNATTVVTSKRDFVPPVPIGSYVVMVFQVAGYTPDCDGSALAQLKQVDLNGKETGWDADHIGLYPDTDLVVDHPSDLLAIVEKK